MKIIVDTNIVFSAILNSNSLIGKIILNSKHHFQFFTCNYLKIEIQRHRHKLLKITKLTNSELFELEELFTHKIKFIDERLILKNTLIETEAQLKTIDPSDAVFVALTKQLKGKLWTGDMQLCRGLRAKGFNDIILTAELATLLSSLK
ncbi:PIN domain-containing protein [Pedobacter endophyticus]|uniref:DNA-binding protein n=1 Tax=Pedobacter endophyticus TaxID=2789740 RepID=A0A7S9KZX4_9SPHI|nr:PIN domain-containing protein [Pedobacter endophyticus]QPH39694.1 DNA-binding protein [Pedobacter endophyticus]